MTRSDVLVRLEPVHDDKSLEETLQYQSQTLPPIEESEEHQKARRGVITERDFPLTAEKTSEFFGYISNDSKQNAKEILSQCKDTSIGSEWSRGYLDALRGMVNSLGSGGAHVPFLLRLREKDVDNIRIVRKEFTERMEKPLICDYDCGFFTAWIQYLSVLLLYQ
jgi:hypothetical protein